MAMILSNHSTKKAPVINIVFYADVNTEHILQPAFHSIYPVQTNGQDSLDTKYFSVINITFF